MYLSDNVSLGIWLLHSLAHVEYNAINLAFDMIIRWAHCYSNNINNTSDVKLPLEFYEDWLEVGADEARHQWCLQRRLEELDMFYGKLPVHNTLWDVRKFYFNPKNSSKTNDDRVLKKLQIL